MAVYEGIYAVYERLASSKMNAMVSAVNSHTHDGTYGVQINFSDLAGSISISQIPNDTINGDHIASGAVTTNHIENGTITVTDIDNTSIHIDANGYAVYAPD